MTKVNILEKRREELEREIRLLIKKFINKYPELYIATSGTLKESSKDYGRLYLRLGKRQKEKSVKHD